MHLLKQRLYQGGLRKARRGALPFALPSGYLWDAEGNGALQCAPDEQGQAVVRRILAQFEELGTLGTLDTLGTLGTLGGLLRSLARQDIRLGVRVRPGSRQGPAGLASAQPRHAAESLETPPLRGRLRLRAATDGSPPLPARPSQEWTRGHGPIAVAQPAAGPRSSLPLLGAV